MRNSFLTLTPLFDAPDALGGGGSPTPATVEAPTPAPATPGAPAVAAPATPTPQPIPGAQPGRDFVPSYRLREAREQAERQAATRYQTQLDTQRAELERYRSQVQALVGVQPPQDPARDTIRQQLFQVAPAIQMLEERAEDIQRLIEDANALRQQTEHYWNSYGRQTMDRLFKTASDSLGAPLSDEGKRALHSAFVGFVQSSPEMTSRYESDPSIVADFWQMLSSTLIDPARRSASAQLAGRVPGALPQDTPGGAPRATPAPKPNDLDERVGLGWAQYNSLTNKV